MARIAKKNDKFGGSIENFNKKSKFSKFKCTPLVKIIFSLSYSAALLIPSVQEYFYYSHLLLTFAVLTYVVLRIFWMIWEYSHISNTTLPVKKDWWEKFRYIFHSNGQIYFLITIVLATMAWLWPSPSYKEFRQNVSYSMILQYILVLFIVYFYQFNDSRFNDILLIRTANFLDYGSAMAYGYYHGYLEIIGTNYGDVRKGITERLYNYEDTEVVTIPVKRLFIIVPINSYIPPQLSEDTNGRLIPSKPLEPLQIDRAGIRNRPFPNMVYRISGPNRWYVCAEGATPIQTLNEAIKAESHMEYLKEEILLKFYLTLKNILAKHDNTINKFDVILYNSNENIADVLERRITEILKENE